MQGNYREKCSCMVRHTCRILIDLYPKEILPQSFVEPVACIKDSGDARCRVKPVRDTQRQMSALENSFWVSGALASILACYGSMPQACVLLSLVG